MLYDSVVHILLCHKKLDDVDKKYFMLKLYSIRTITSMTA